MGRVAIATGEYPSEAEAAEVVRTHRRIVDHIGAGRPPRPSGSPERISPPPRRCVLRRHVRATSISRRGRRPWRSPTSAIRRDRR